MGHAESTAGAEGRSLCVAPSYNTASAGQSWVHLARSKARVLLEEKSNYRLETQRRQEGKWPLLWIEVTCIDFWTHGGRDEIQMPCPWLYSWQNVTVWQFFHRPLPHPPQVDPCLPTCYFLVRCACFLLRKQTFLPGGGLSITPALAMAW